jgi:uncharacterized protein (TIGR00299 family) protein
MRIAFLDCFSGLSGDMFLGAAVAAGVPLAKLQDAAASLGLGARLEARSVMRSGISATQVEVLIHGHSEHPLDDPAPPAPAHSHPHEHHHEHGTHPSGDTHRGLPEIRPILARAAISAAAQAFALKAFELLAAAEGKIHNRPPESIHFHEVGSEDAIVDIVCAAVAVEALTAERWYSSALNVGSGTVRCAHGTLPVPAPATAELLMGAPIYSAGPQKELLTPTGAAILRALDVRFEPLPAVQLTAAGYGAGGRDIAGHANVVRMLVGDAAQTASPGADDVYVLEANLDDMNPQIFAYVQQKLLAAGALDAFGTPVQMKKGRPGLLFTVLAPPALEESLSRILLTETTTLGVRRRLERRRTLERRHVSVVSPWGPIRVKLGLLQGEVVNCAPEFEDCRTIAEANGIPLKNVIQEATRLYLSSAASPQSGLSASPTLKSS